MRILALTIAMTAFSTYGCNDSEFSGSSAKARPSSENQRPRKPLPPESEPEEPVVVEEKPITETGGMDCDKGKPGFVGKVFKLPTSTTRLPDLNAMTPVGQIDALQLDVSPRAWESGFPGLPSLQEWFAVQFVADLVVPETGMYEFKISSDDGSNVYIDKALLINNDGVHSVIVKTATRQLTKGTVKLGVDWFQGPRKHIALQLYWRKPNSGDFRIITQDDVSTGRDCNLQTIGTFP